MSRNESLEIRVASWLVDESPGQMPDRVLRATFERTRATRQERILSGWRPFPMSWKVFAFATGAVAITVALIAGSGLLNVDRAPVGVPPVVPSVVPSPVGSPTDAPSRTLAPVTGLPGRLAFATNRTGNFEIYSMKPDRSELVQLTHDPAEDRDPDWSPDGTRILFARADGPGTSIWVMNSDGSGARRLGDGGQAQWSRDGRRIVYQAGPTIFVMDADGTARAQVITEVTIGLLIGGPSWSADGSRILFTGAPVDGTTSDVYVVGLDGKGLKRLTSTPADDASPRTSPDGSLIAYETHYRCICVMKADGSEPTLLTIWSAKGSRISWSPDGRWIAYAGGAHGPGYLQVVSSDGSKGQLLADTGDFYDVSWGP